MTNWARGELGRLAFYILLLVLGLVGLLMLLAGLAHGHGPHYSAAEIAWMERQHARDGMKCCNERDVHIGQDVEWRMGAGGYQVRIGEAWHDVPPGRLLAPRPGDPSPFGAQALLFYSPTPGGVPRLWCFMPEPLM